MLGDRRQKSIQRVEYKSLQDAFALQGSSWTLRWTVPICPWLREEPLAAAAPRQDSTEGGTLQARAMIPDIPSTSTARTSTHTAEELYFFIPILPASKAIGIPSRTEKIGLGPLSLLRYLTEIKIKETSLLSRVAFPF